MKITKFCASTALLLVGSTGASAQSTATTPSAKPTAPSSTTQAQTAGQPQWYSHQANEMRASKLIGANVVNASNENVGEVNDIILEKDGKVAAVVIGVGGFLGMGERKVAVSFNTLQVRHNSGDKASFVMNTTKETLKGAPEWHWDAANK